MSEVCRETETEPPLQPLSGEIILPPSANKREDAPGSILRLSDFGDGSKAHFFMLGFFTPTRQATVTKVLQLYSGNMN